MHLRRLKIHSLPGIEPGFDFEPETDGVNIVTGPNAIGKSSLSRALRYLLAGVDRRGDPPNVHLEAEFQAGDVRWTVQRIGRQVHWMRGGKRAEQGPSLPSADQFGLYRLSMESLIADDKSDRSLAASLWRTVRGGFDLDGARVMNIGPLFAKSDERTLLARRKALAEVQGEYRELQFQEAKLPEIARRIGEAEEAAALREHLKMALELHEAIRMRRERSAALEGFPVEMARLHGNEIERLDGLDERAARLRKQLREAQEAMEAGVREIERTGLERDCPDSERVAQVRKLMQGVERDAIERDNAQLAVEKAEARLNSVRAELGGGEAPPRLDAGSLDRARKLIEPLGDLRIRRRELEQRLELAGDPPEQSEIERLREGVGALRAWLAALAVAGNDTDAAWVWFGTRVAWWATLTLAALTAAAALWVGAQTLFGTALGAVGVLLLFSWLGRRAGAQAAAPMDAARRRFEETGLESPPEWNERPVREYLRIDVEARLNRLLVRRERAEGAASRRAELEKVETRIRELESRKSVLASELGIDPELCGAPFLRFIAVTEKWDAARSDHEGKEASLRIIDARISKAAARIRRLLEPLRSADAPPLGDSIGAADLDALRVAFDALDARLSRAEEAEGAIESARDRAESLNEQLQGVESEQAGLYAQAGLESEARDELVQRIDRMKAWRQACSDLNAAEIEEKRLRSLLADRKALIEAVENGVVQDLQQRLRAASDKADDLTGLIKEQERVNVLLKEARRKHRLEDAAGELSQAEESLKDKRARVLLHTATELLLDDVERAFKTEREPSLLRNAREQFERVTAYAFTLELTGKTGFGARDLKQDEPRSLAKLSSGTRMQLLLALRLAWIEDGERGGESLPLFLDEALTTSDEGRFSVMARSLSRLAESEERQIFYLSARRHEAALWEQVTGSAPSVIDLAEVRFGSTPPVPSLPVETPPPLPPPNGSDAASYARRIGAHAVDPRVDAGAIHLFHLLRDDLSLLHHLLVSWGIGTLGQLESLLASNAGRSAISDPEARKLLRHRCRAARSWTELWRQGQGRPVDRIALEQCPAITYKFIDKATDLAEELEGDGEALVQALANGRLKHFQARKIIELTDWLAEHGYIDAAAILAPAERRRLALQRVVPGSQADPMDVNQVVDWMESAVVSQSGNGRINLQADSAA